MRRSPTRRAGRTLLTSELVSTDVVAFKYGHFLLVRRFYLSALPAERSSAPRGRRRRQAPGRRARNLFHRPARYLFHRPPRCLFRRGGCPGTARGGARGGGHHHAVPHSGGHAARRPGRPRHPRAGADRIGQDARLLHPAGRGTGRRLHQRLPPARPGARADPGARQPGPRRPRAAGRIGGAERGDDLRRGPPEAAGGQAPRPRRYRRRVPGQAGRPHRAGPLPPRRRGDQRARRGGPHGRSRVPARRAAAAGHDPGRRPADAVLRDARRRRRRPGAALHEPPGAP